MCGIVGAIASENIVVNILEGLKKLEYRGYDSAGISVLDNNIFKTVKEEGKIERLVSAIKNSSALNSYLNIGELSFIDQDNFSQKEDRKPDVKNLDSKNMIAIGHTRWATHGRPSQENSHPHASSEICVVHNGIIENYQEIRKKLANLGASFLSETDSEVVPHLLQENFRLVKSEFSNLAAQDQIKKALMKTLSEIDGSYALAIMFRDYPDFIAVAKKGSPLLVGYGKDCNYIASDYYALSDNTNEIIHLNDNEFSFVYKDRAEFYNKSGEKIEREVKFMEKLIEKTSKNGYDHFMLKEIFEQPEILSNNIKNYVDLENYKINLPKFTFDIKNINKITIIACGTSYYAAMAAKYLFEEISRIEVEVDIASEFRYRKTVFRDDNLMIFISQSGETADTIAALKYAKENNQKILSIVNSSNSSMEELSDVVVKTIAGIEIGVASTKAYTSQIVILSLLAIEFGEKKNNLSQNSCNKNKLITQICKIDKKIANILSDENVDKIKDIANYLLEFENALYVGRGVSYVSALEGSLKLKELSYINCQAIAAGELKHGTIALIDEKMPVIAMALSNNLFEKTASNIEEIKARKGKIIAISDKKGVKSLGDLADFTITIPDSESIIEEVLIGIIPLQLLAYYVALFKGNDVDQPRNLAKSVTVE